MNLELLRTFLEISKTRHFGQAAENLYLTQSAVSFRIKQLEELVGVTLLTRDRNNILLTPSGERLLLHAENILTSWQLALQDVGISKNQHTQLSLGATSNLWDTFLQSMLPKLANEFPGLYLRTEISSHQDLTKALLGGRLDIIVVLEPPTAIGLKSLKIGELELVFASNRKGLSLKDIPEFGYVYVDWGTAFNLQQARLFLEPIAPILHTGQSHLALEFILAHGGAAFFPKALIARHIAEGSLFLVDEIKPVSRDVFCVYSEKTERVKDFLPITTLLQELELKPHDGY